MAESSINDFSTVVGSNLTATVEESTLSLACGVPANFLTQYRLYGAGRETRTPDLRFTKPLLYQLSYTGTAEGGARVQVCAARIEY